MKILVTGGSGFIGSALVRHVLQHRGQDVRLRCLVRNSNQRNLKRLFLFDHVRRAEHDGRLHVIQGDLLGDISGLCEDIDAGVHLAAKTFVDHSIRDPLPFVEANVLVCDKIKQLGWQPQVELAAGLERAVAWYADNPWWLE